MNAFVERIKKEMVISAEEHLLIQAEIEYQKQQDQILIGKSVTLSETGKRIFKYQGSRNRRDIGIIMGKSKTPNCWIIKWNRIKYKETLNQSFLSIIE